HLRIAEGRLQILNHPWQDPMRPPPILPWIKSISQGMKSVADTAGEAIPSPFLRVALKYIPSALWTPEGQIPIVHVPMRWARRLRCKWRQLRLALQRRRRPAPPCSQPRRNTATH
ncbi:MAG: hypothetical protein RMK32_10260, partial [Anaerolineae bacterium]|nr:hypothetical protein [Anaerolineae bacterium]